MKKHYFYSIPCLARTCALAACSDDDKSSSAKAGQDTAGLTSAASPDPLTSVASDLVAKRAERLGIAALFPKDMGVVAGVYDIPGIYFALFGLAAVFLFSGAHVLPTARNNKTALTREWEQAQADLAAVLPKDFPLPARYAHPVVLTRMIRVLREGQAQTADEALDVVKRDLKALTADVQVEQWEYDEVVAVKPMFLLSDYQ